YIHNAAKGQMVLSERLAVIMATALKNEAKSNSASVDDLTNRELQILKLLTLGDSNKHIARKLGIAEATVKVHVKSLLKKLKLRSRVEAAVWAVERKIK
ncbi:MAG: two-component system response regulator NarL, partial [Sinobacterium sp.]|nr:two-component system response regulator NarL [Sinobacterium sp.]